MTINTNNTTAACSGGAELAVATAIVHIRALFEVAPWMATENYVPGCGLVTFADLKAIQEYADTQFEAADLQASAPRSASAGDDEQLAAWARNWHWNDCAEDKPVDPSIYFRDMRMLKAFLASNPLEGKGIQSHTEQAISGLRSPEHGEG